MKNYINSFICFYILNIVIIKIWKSYIFGKLEGFKKYDVSKVKRKGCLVMKMSFGFVFPIKKC